MRSFAFGTGAVACSSSGSSTGLSKQFGALITRDGSRQEIADIPRFAAPLGDARSQCARRVTRITVGQHCARRPRHDLLIWEVGFTSDFLPTTSSSRASRHVRFVPFGNRNPTLHGAAADRGAEMQQSALTPSLVLPPCRLEPAGRQSVQTE